MAINKIGIKDYANTNSKSLKGVTFVYVSRNGESAINLNGPEFVPADKTREEAWKVWRNVIKLHWDVALMVRGLKVDNGGIASKLRTSTPAQIVIRTESGDVALRWVKDKSVFERVGLMPTLKDIEEVEEERKKTKDYAQKAHRAAAASFNALTKVFKFEKAGEVPAPAETSAE